MFFLHGAEKGRKDDKGVLVESGEDRLFKICDDFLTKVKPQNPRNASVVGRSDQGHGGDRKEAAAGREVQSPEAGSGQVQ